MGSSLALSSEKFISLGLFAISIESISFFLLENSIFICSCLDFLKSCALYISLVSLSVKKESLVLGISKGFVFNTFNLCVNFVINCLFLLIKESLLILLFISKSVFSNSVLIFCIKDGRILLKNPSSCKISHSSILFSLLLKLIII